MRKLMKTVLMGLFIVGMVILAPQNTLAAPPDPDCDPLDPACPVDGGVTILIAAGIGLGVKRAFRKNEHEKP
jgi:hypothetical protein